MQFNANVLRLCYSHLFFQVPGSCPVVLRLQGKLIASHSAQLLKLNKLKKPAPEKLKFQKGGSV